MTDDLKKIKQQDNEEASTSSFVQREDDSDARFFTNSLTRLYLVDLFIYRQVLTSRQDQAAVLRRRFSRLLTRMQRGALLSCSTNSDRSRNYLKEKRMRWIYVLNKETTETSLTSGYLFSSKLQRNDS